MEFLAPAGAAAAAEAARRWREGGGDPDFAALRRAALSLDARYRARVPWWDGIDLNEGNVRRAADGRLAVVDLFCVDGAALYAQVLRDATVVRRRMSAGQCRHLLQIPYLARESSPVELQALHDAWGG